MGIGTKGLFIILYSISQFQTLKPKSKACKILILSKQSQYNTTYTGTSHIIQKEHASYDKM